jgi:excisionase family DNA binding protein
VITQLTGVFLDRSEAMYVSRALELLAALLAEKRSQPTPRLQQVTAKLRKSAESGSTATPNGRKKLPLRASADSGPDDQGYATVTTAEAARILRCRERNTRDLIRRGQLPARRAGGRWLIDAAAVERRAERKAARRKG